MVVSKWIKYLGIDLPKETKYLYLETKTLLKEIKTQIKLKRPSHVYTWEYLMEIPIFQSSLHTSRNRQTVLL